MREAGDQSTAYRIRTRRENDGNRAGRCFGRPRCGCGWGDDHVDLELRQLLSERGERLEPALGESELDQDVLAFDVTERPKLCPERVYVVAGFVRRASSE